MSKKINSSTSLPATQNLEFRSPEKTQETVKAAAKRPSKTNDNFNLNTAVFSAEASRSSNTDLFTFNPVSTMKYDIASLPSTDKTGNLHLGRPIAPGSIPFRSVNAAKAKPVSTSKVDTSVMQNLLQTLKSDDSDASKSDVPTTVDELLYKTGEDAIAFFARYGVSTSTKFVHCKIASTDELAEFRPYDLTVVPHKEVSSDYYTISSSGVVHIQVWILFKVILILAR